MLPQEFVAKWRALIALPDFKETAYYQQHLIDLCALVGHPPPATSHAQGSPFAFEKTTQKEEGGTGFADAWYKGRFAIEYKGPGADLDKAYKQLRAYADALGNPPLLVVCDFNRIIIHPRFNNSANRPVTVTLGDLLTPEGQFRIRSMFNAPDALRTEAIAERVTKEAAVKFSYLAAHLGKWGHNPHDVAHYLIRLLFCLFAEDIDLLQSHVFSDLVANGARNPDAFNKPIRRLFNAMAEGDFFGKDKIKYFNGGLFDDDFVLELDSDALRHLADISQLDWSTIEPAIFGTLFTRSLDPSQRAKLGAQYTSKDDILLVVEPVLMAPLRREWETIKTRARDLAPRRDAAPTTRSKNALDNELRTLVMGFVDKIRSTRVLDPACGSGNFLYISMRLLMDLEQEVSHFCGEVGLQPFFPEVGPAQMFGIEVNDYAHELAQTTLWIGFLQWRHANGYGFPTEPILKPLDNIKLMDAILAYDTDGKPVEPEWPEADVIVGNPPFLGWNKLRAELGDRYVTDLNTLYKTSVPLAADLVCYWFERGREQVCAGNVKRVGLLATNSIRGGANRQVLDRILGTGSIFMAWSDRPWVLEGAAVRVSMIAFDNGDEQTRTLNNQPVGFIAADLNSDVDLGKAGPLQENRGIAFIGDTKKGRFDISEDLAAWLMNQPLNSNGRPNSDVIRPWANGYDVTRRPQRVWIIDFGTSVPETKAAQYEAPFEYLRQNVKPQRDLVRNDLERSRWWLHGRPAADCRSAIAPLQRFIATPTLSKYRLFTWLLHPTLPDHQLVVFARDDNYFFGVLHAKPHELWALRKGTSLEDRPRYTPSTTFETYPFPWPPGQEPQDDPRVQAIAAAAKQLVELRDGWLNPPDIFGAELNKRTLTNLYNERPAWLDAAHKELDAAVFAAYGWPADPSDEEILARLLALNLERARG